MLARSTMKTAFLVVAVLVAATCVSARVHPAGFGFDDWLELYGRGDYAVGGEEYEIRRALFHSRMADVDAHNANPSK